MNVCEKGTNKRGNVSLYYYCSNVLIVAVLKHSHLPPLNHSESKDPLDISFEAQPKKLE